MIKRILLTASVAALALGSLSLHSYGDTPTPTVTCLTPKLTGYYKDLSIKYDTRSGIALDFYSDESSGARVHAAVPLLQGDEPNPHFDRLYSMIMKGSDSGRLAQVCVDGVPGTYDNKVYPVVSVTLKHVGDSDSPQKVQVCDRYGECAGVYGGQLSTSK
jgi:hypothetical protein